MDGNKSSAGPPGLSDTQQMMYAFGDFRRPNPDSARIVEQVVLAQLRTIIHLATNLAENRGSKILIIEDILYLMRKSPIKIQRLIQYLKIKDKKDELSLLEKGETWERQLKTTVRCRNFLEKIDETGVLLAACDKEHYDEVYHERLVRHDRITKNLDERKYLDFCKARRVSFRGKYSQWFQSSLQDVVDTLDIKLEKLTNDVICYLAYETLGQLIELCLVVRRDSSFNSVDKLNRLLPIQSINTAFPNLAVPVRDKNEGIKNSDYSGCPLTPAEVREAVRRLQDGERTRTMFGGRKSLHGLQPEPNVPLLAI
ncbi:transcription initiation protein SPT3 homolog [Eurytemora carolleeae]|uniref:transcription initiation protein SPT3 homolog n=1 Tax=Eurytemora carolleeae TaxID=1294199 RepID=UPI000C76AF4B|nr:transcription initiation protein SPT3 homolog [Eurytemora carolleeae]|eukprot:XP_023341029.1 transcription initiation protein SPT3 homolog [Eurytemora affinis]